MKKVMKNIPSGAQPDEIKAHKLLSRPLVFKIHVDLPSTLSILKPIYERIQDIIMIIS